MGLGRVVRSSGMLVKPREKTPTGRVQLSGLDQVAVLRCNARTLHVYSNSNNNVNIIIREALSKALVAYHPLAGRLKQDGDGSVHVDCTGEGVWFVEASADCTLLPDYNVPHAQHQLLPDYDYQGQLPPLIQMQVTHFSCGGFVIGLLFNHTVCDGLGAAQFLKAVGELARGSHQLSVRPVWSRDFFTGPIGAANAAPAPPPPPPPPELVQATLDIPAEQIKRLKRLFHPCSSFELVAAAFWRCRTRAISIDNDNSTSTLVFFANCRHLVEPPLPRGFYGNCFFPVRVTAPSQVVAGDASLPHLIRLVQKAKAGLPEDFSQYIAGTADPFAAPPPPFYETSLYLSEWGRLGFSEVDFGWGPPADVVPIQGSPLIPAGILGWQPAPAHGLRLMTWCVQQQHRHRLLHQLSLLFSTADT